MKNEMPISFFLSAFASTAKGAPRRYNTVSSDEEQRKTDSQLVNVRLGKIKMEDVEDYNIQRALGWIREVTSGGTPLDYLKSAHDENERRW